jgi:hypothetical protein
MSVDDLSLDKISLQSASMVDNYDWPKFFKLEEWTEEFEIFEFWKYLDFKTDHSLNQPCHPEKKSNLYPNLARIK